MKYRQLLLVLIVLLYYWYYCRMVPWFIIKRTWIETETIGDPSREWFPMFMVETAKQTMLKAKKEVDSHTAYLKATMRK